MFARAFLWNTLFYLLFIPAVVISGTTGKIAGTVVDAESGDPLPGANVVIEGTSLGAAANLDGEFFILRVPPNVYTVKASMMGYRTVHFRDVRVSIDKTTTLKFELPLTVLESDDVVTVIAQRPIVERDLTSTSVTVSSDMIERLPVENLSDVVNLQAGVVEGHFRGGRSGEVAYLIDGVSLNDVYSGGSSLDVENNAVQEVQVISGTFNAEYGQAMSGVVNIVTKEGSNHYHGQLSAYASDHYSRNSDIFWNINSLTPAYDLQGALSGPVPLFGEKFTFFASGRYHHTNGTIYGKDIFQPSDSSNFPSSDVRDWSIESHGKVFRFESEEDFARISDSLYRSADYVSMNPSRRLSGQVKLSYKFNPSNRIDYEGLIQRQKYKEYDHLFRFNPKGDYWRHQFSWSNSLSFTHVFNEKTFLVLKGSRFFSDYRQYVYKDPYDPRYVNPALLDAASGNAFLTGGQKMWHFYRNSTTTLGRVDLTSQITQVHQVKTGFEWRGHRLWLRAFEIRLNRDTGWEPFVPDRKELVQNNDEYLYHPCEMAAYIQDKIELDYMVVNAGVRFDYFESDAAVPQDFSDPARSRLQNVESTYQISPRIGLSYPITDNGAIHVSYGHFFQIPNFEYLYTNPEFELYATSDYGSTNPPERTPNTIGNASLEPQKTTIYELGLQQKIMTDVSLDITAFFKDIRNLLGTEILHTTTGIRYARYINRDYGNVKGLTFSLEKRFSQGLGTTLDYTYQIAKGNASDPVSAFLDVQAGREPQKQIVPLNWDRTHSLNATLTLGDPDDVSISFIGKLGSGLPYTPTQQNIRTAVENSERKPLFHNVDMYLYKQFDVDSFGFFLFLRVFNLFDRKNHLDVYTSTGRADYSLEAKEAGTIFGVNSQSDFIIRPDFYSAPRQIIAGIRLEF